MRCGQLRAQSPLLGTEFLDAETGRQKSSLRLSNAHRDKNLRIERPEIPAETPYWRRIRKVRFAKTGWWCAQSHANRSLLNISLFSGNLTGKFAIFRPWRHFYIVEAAVPQRFFTKFPKKINRVKLLDNRDRNRVNSEIRPGYQVSVHFSHTCLMARGRDLFSPSIYRLRRARWRARSDHGRVRVRLSGGRTTRRGSAAT